MVLPAKCTLRKATREGDAYVVAVAKGTFRFTEEEPFILEESDPRKSMGRCLARRLEISADARRDPEASEGYINCPGCNLRRKYTFTPNK